MGNGWSNISCTSYFRTYRIMQKKYNLTIIAITLILYSFNQITKSFIYIKAIKWFMVCYFNDIVGGITFISYCNVICGVFVNRQIIKLLQIEMLMFFCGLFWEYITPIFRKNTTSDIWDILAYMIGGFIYWIIVKRIKIKQDKL